MGERYDYGNQSTHRFAEQIESTVLFAAAFVALLGVELVSALLPWTWRRRLASSERSWFFGRAWDQAGTWVELAYMG